MLQVKHVSKSFGALQVLRQVSLSIARGEVVGLTGRSGSGRTTLVRVIGGLLKADEGEIILDGVSITSDNSRARMSIIHQQPELVTMMDITNNIFLGNELGWRIGPFTIPRRRIMDKQAADLLNALDAPFDSLSEPVANLSGEQRQLVAIAQAMARPNDLIILDKPETLISYPYQQKLLSLIQSWQRNGRAVLFSSDNLDHLFAVTDRLLIMRDGAIVGQYPTDDTNREDVVAALVGTTDREQRTPVIWALDSYFQAREQAETLQHNQRLLRRDLAARDNLNQQLVERLSEQVEALDSANLALQDAQRRLLTEREQERKRLARELHDQAIQDLLSLNYQLEEMVEMAATAEMQNEVVDIRHTIRNLVEDLRRICGDLRPPTIDSLGLTAALRSFTHDWEHRTGIKVDLNVDEVFGRLPEAIELSVFRIVQESLNNVRKHADATEVTVTMLPSSPRMLRIAIADNGNGMEAAADLAQLAQNGHYGLLGISERVALLGGRMRIKNQTGQGLLIEAEIPHPKSRSKSFLR